RMPGVVRVEVAGSIRRRKETVGDADLLALARTAEAAIAAFAKLPAVARVLGQGDTKCSVKLQDGLQVDLRVVPEESFGAALLYFTGSKAHNVALRQLAIKKGWKLNEYGLFRGTRRIAGRTEQEIYDRLGLAWIPPELREDQGEIDAARAGTLPRLVEGGDLRGDLQTQTNWTDGADSLEAMARAATGAARPDRPRHPEPARRHPLPPHRPRDPEARALRGRHRSRHRRRQGDRHRARAGCLPRPARSARRARAARDRGRRPDRH